MLALVVTVVDLVPNTIDLYTDHRNLLDSSSHVVEDRLLRTIIRVDGLAIAVDDARGSTRKTDVGIVGRVHRVAGVELVHSDTNEVVWIVLGSLLHTRQDRAWTPSATVPVSSSTTTPRLKTLEITMSVPLASAFSAWLAIAIDLRHLDRDVAVLDLRATSDLHVELAFATNSNGIGQIDMLLSLSLAIDSDHIVEVAGRPPYCC